MAVTSAQIVDFLLANPGMTDDQIVTAMETYGISPAQMAQAVGVPVGDVISRAAATVPQGQTVTLGDTIIAPEYRVIGSGEDQQIGNLETIYTCLNDISDRPDMFLCGMILAFKQNYTFANIRVYSLSFEMLFGTINSYVVQIYHAWR